MKIIRQSIYETNSSSTHSITMCMKSDYEKWKNGELYYFRDTNDFITKEERNRILKEMILEDKIDIDYNNKTITFNGKTVNYTDWEDKEQKIKEMMTDEELSKITETEIDKYLEESFDKYEMPCSYEDYYGNMEYETYKTDFVTPKGEEVVSFGYYGNSY